MARKTNITAKTILDNRQLKDGVNEADTILSGFANKAKVGMAAGGVAAAATFTEGFTQALGREQFSNAFGDELVSRSATVYRDAWGESLDDVVRRMDETQRAFGDDANLENITAQAFALSERFERDVSGSIQDASELAESFGITGERSLDLLAGAFEGASGEVRDELSAAIREYGDFFDQLGLSAGETLTLLTDFGEDGARSLDKAADALKELTIRGTDMSEASTQAYREAGLEADEIANKLLAGGNIASEAFTEIVVGLQSIEDPATQANAAIALFGTPLEDLGTAQIPAFLEVLVNLEDGLAGTEGAAASLADSVGGDLTDRLESYKRRGFDALAETIDANVIPQLHRFLDWGEEHWPTISGVVGQAWTDITGSIQTAWDFIQPLFDGDWRTVWEGLKTIAQDVTSDAWEWLKEDGKDMIGGFLTGAQEYWTGTAWPWLQRRGTQAAAAIGDAATWLWDKGRDFMGGLVGGAQEWWNTEGRSWFSEDVPSTLSGWVDLAKDTFFTVGQDIGRIIVEGWNSILTGEAPGFGSNPLFDIGGGETTELAPGADYYLPPEAGAFTVPQIGSGPNYDGTSGLGPGNPDNAGFGIEYPTFHTGGYVTQAAANRQRFRGLGHNEVMAKVEVGEYITPRGGNAPLIGTVNMTNDRSLEDELRLVLALHGGAPGLAAAS